MKPESAPADGGAANAALIEAFYAALGRRDADATTGRAHWVATYTYSATGHRVENRIDATFAFRDGRIVRHQDRFDLYRWARQALGLKGVLLGWLPPVQGAIRRQAAATLAAWRAKEEAVGPSAR